LFRYAEVLLAYAEALNEFEGPVEQVYWAVNEVRERSGLPPLREGFNQEKMRSAIYREGRVELAVEEKRWLDLLRLRLAEDKLNGTLHAMKIERNDGEFVYSVIPAAGGMRKFYERNYRLPIPQSAMDQNKNLVQNPGYQ